MLTSLAFALLLFAVVLWIEAHERRAVFATVQTSVSMRRGLKVGGWVLATLALFLCAEPQGWERGIPIWLAWFIGAAFVALLFSARFRGRHWQLGAAAGAAAVFFSVAAVAGG